MNHATVYVKIKEYPSHKNRRSVFKNIITHALAGASISSSSLYGRLTFLICICVVFLLGPFSQPDSTT